MQSCFQTAAFNHRSTNQGFNQLNLGDYYVELVKSLGPLLGMALRETPAMDKCIPLNYKGSHRAKDSMFTTTPADLSEPEPVTPPALVESEPPSSEQPNGDVTVPNIPPPAPEAKSKNLTKAEKEAPGKFQPQGLHVYYETFR
jgi:E3 ubiquitin-protein ligase HUWE1